MAAIQKVFVNLKDLTPPDNDIKTFTCPGQDIKDINALTPEDIAKFASRADLHKSIVNHFFSGKAPPTGRNPKFTILMGTPGTGKSTYIHKVIMKPTVVLLSGDEIGELLPENIKCTNYGKDKNQSVTECANGSLCRQETTYIFMNLLLERVLREKFDFVYDTTGKTLAIILKMLNIIKTKGLNYDIEIYYVNVGKVETAIERAMKRSKITGRIVSESYLRETFAVIDGNFKDLNEEIKKLGFTKVAFKCLNDGAFTEDPIKLKSQCTEVKNKYLKYKQKYLDLKKELNLI